MSGPNDGSAQSINELLRGIVAAKKPAKSTKTVRQHLTDDRAIFEVAHDILETYVNPSAPKVQLRPENVGRTSQLLLPVGSDSELKQLFELQRNRAARLQALNEAIVKNLSTSVKSIKAEEARISKWHTGRTRGLETTRREWKTKAGDMSRVVEENSIPARVSVEREWRELARAMPRGHARDIMEAGIPLIGRSDITKLTGGAATDTMVSRARRQQSATETANNVHWKLRHAVDDIVDKHLARVTKSAELAAQSISSGAVRRTRGMLDEAKAKHDAEDAILDNRVQRLVRSLTLRGVSFDHIMSHCAQLVSRQRKQHFNRLVRLLAE